MDQPEDPWRVTWAGIVVRLVQQLPPEALAALKVAFNRFGAVSVNDFFEQLNREAHFTGNSKQVNLGILFHALHNWRDFSAVGELHRAVITAPWGSQCLVVSALPLKLINTLFPTSAELSGIPRLFQFPHHPQVKIFYCDDVDTDLDYVFRLLLDYRRRNEDVFLLYVGSCHDKASVLQEKKAVLPTMLQWRPVDPNMAEHPLPRKEVILRHAQLAERSATRLVQKILEVPLQFISSAQCNEEFATAFPLHDHQSYLMACQAQEQRATWAALLAPHSDVPCLDRLVSHLALSLTSEPAMQALTFTTLEARVEAGRERDNHIPTVIGAAPPGTPIYLAAQRRSKVLFTFCTPLWVYWHFKMLQLSGGKVTGSDMIITEARISTVEDFEHPVRHSVPDPIFPVRLVRLRYLGNLLFI